MEHVIIQTEQMTVDYPRISAGFQCFVCGTRFVSNEERIEHLEKGSHGSMGACMIPVRLKKRRMLEDVES